jgi:hypothetical protein
MATLKLSGFMAKAARKGKKMEAKESLAAIAFGAFDTLPWAGSMILWYRSSVAVLAMKSRQG